MYVDEGGCYPLDALCSHGEGREGVVPYVVEGIFGGWADERAVLVERVFRRLWEDGSDGWICFS